jgi:hypothetical protein
MYRGAERPDNVVRATLALAMNAGNTQGLVGGGGWVYVHLLLPLDLEVRKTLRRERRDRFLTVFLVQHTCWKLCFWFLSFREMRILRLSVQYL